MCLLFVKTVVVIIRRLNTLRICIVIAFREGGRGNPIYRLYRCERRQKVWFFIFFGLKKGINFDRFGLDMFFLEEATTKTISLWVLGQPGTFCNSTVLYSFVSYLIKAYQHCL